jgi:hypothetical protein
MSTGKGTGKTEQEITQSHNSLDGRWTGFYINSKRQQDRSFRRDGVNYNALVHDAIFELRFDLPMPVRATELLDMSHGASSTAREFKGTLKLRDTALRIFHGTSKLDDGALLSKRLPGTLGFTAEIQMTWQTEGESNIRQQPRASLPSLTTLPGTELEATNAPRENAQDEAVEKNGYKYLRVQIGNA